MQTHPQLPDNIDELKALLTAQFAIVQTLTSERDEIKSERDSWKSESETLKSEAQLLKQSQCNNLEEIKRLTLLIAKLQRQLFGQKSERLSAQIDQLKLELEELHINEGEVQSKIETLRSKRTVASHERSAPSRNPLPEHLPRERQEILPESENCADCGTKLFRLGEDMSETLVWVPGYFKVVQNVRPKFTCRCCQTFTQAPAPHRPIDRSYASPELLAHIMVSKYLDHLPLYRQCEMFARQGMDISDSTMGDWVGGVHDLLEPLMAELKKHVFAATKLHADDTPIRVLAPGTGKTRTARLWVYARDDRPSGGTSPPAVWFRYSPDRKSIHPQTHLQHYEGILQADAYAGFNAVYESGRITEAGCWAHARRKFYDLHVLNATPTTEHVLKVITQLYDIERAIRGQEPELRQTARQKQSKPLIDKLHAWMLEQLQRLSKKSTTAEAIGYALNHWTALTRFLDDGRIEVDNNTAERALRSVAVGRKNYLFLGSDNGGDRAATLYSLLGTAKLNDINPEKYLTHVLSVIADHKVNKVGELLPWNVKL
ncbi:MAG: IS66 family transposase [Burkholderiaceae bacterium]|nr:IS66 family transposase [Burkholderiaceae bacterium]